MIEYDNGIGIEGLDFVLDAGRRSECSFVSHAHSDHARKHKKIVATPETALLYRRRYPSVPTRAIPFGHRTKIGSASVELFPSGHMLGAAQIMVDIKGTRIVYTGDFKVYPNLTCPPLETRHCDILIMESTYGDPTYCFPPQNEVYTRIVMFIKRCLVDGNVPVLVGYATGKAQEAVMLAQQHGFEVCVDSPVDEMNDLYRSAGVKLRPTPNWHKSSLHGKVLVVSPQTLRSDSYKRMRRAKSVFLTGWAQGEGTNRYTSADWSLPLSDHADYTQLLHYVEMCDPAKIYTLHGDPKFAQILSGMGYDAEYLGKGSKGKPLASKKAQKPRKIVAGQNYELF